MPTRREFLQGVIAFPVFSQPWTGAVREQPHQFFNVILDWTLGREAEAFRAAVAGRGIGVRSVANDLGFVWMNEIEPRWRDSPAAMAGLTGGSSLFCLELLVRGYGMRLLYRAEHTVGRSGSIRHTITGPAELVEWEDRLAAAGPRWPAVAAAMAFGCPTRLKPKPNIELLDLAGRRGVEERVLYSWVIAPFLRNELRVV